METVKYEIREGTIVDKIPNLFHLFNPHWDEVAKNKQVMILSPDMPKYELLESTGKLKTLLAYANGEIVGYSVNIVDVHLHYNMLKVAYNDILYLTPEYRESPLGLRLIRETERWMKRLDVKLMLWHAKEGTPLAKILPALKYGTQEICFSKIL